MRTLALGCTYCGGEGSPLASPEVGRRLYEAIASRERELVLRTTWEICYRARCREDAALYDAYIAVALQRPVAQAVIMAQMRAIAAHDTSARLPGLDLPTLIVHGTADELIPVRERPCDRRARAPCPAGAPRRGGPPLLLGGAAALRGARARPCRGARVGVAARELSVLTDDGVLLSGEDAGEQALAADRAAARSHSHPAVCRDGLAPAGALRVPGDRLRRPWPRAIRPAPGGGGVRAAGGEAAYGFERLARDLGAVLDALGIPCAALAGASMGAHTILRFALDHPERVDALGLVTPAFDPAAPAGDGTGSGARPPRRR